KPRNSVATSSGPQEEPSQEFDGISSSLPSTRNSRASPDPDDPKDRFLYLTGGRRPSKIPSVELRGILQQQLARLVAFIKHRTDENGVLTGWCDDSLGGPTPYWHTVNLYMVTAHVIKPVTGPDRCSYVEAVSERPQDQKPDRFVSHWWGEPVADFAKCVFEHQSVRSLPDSTAYWVCAYANNQHELGGELGTDPMTSSFLKAMQLSDGVLLILDPGSMPFSRVWCIFEMGVLALAARGLLDQSEDVETMPLEEDRCFIPKPPKAPKPVTQKETPRPSLTRDRTRPKNLMEREALLALTVRDGCGGRKPPLLLDVATVDKNGKAQLLINGLTAAEQAMEEIHQLESCRPSGWDSKSEREKHFPIETVDSGLAISITSAQASQGIDKVRILNALASRQISELDEDYHPAHDNYDTVNQVLRSTFALAAFRRTAEQEVSDSATSYVARLAIAIREDQTRRVLELHLGRETPLPHIEILADGINHLSGLQYLTLNLSQCRYLTSVDRLGKSLSQLVALRSLRLDLSRCTRLSDVSGLGGGLSSMCRLRQLFLNFRFTAITNLAEFGPGLAHLKALKHLTLIFRSTGLFSLAGLGPGLAPLSGLEYLKINLRHCRCIRSILELRQCLIAMVNLTHFTLDLTGCRGLRTFDGLAIGLSALKSLQHLDIDTNGCRTLKCVAHVGGGLLGLTSLKHLKIDMTFCKSVKDVSAIATGLETCTSLEHLSLIFSSCEHLPSVAELGLALRHLKHLHYLSLDFSSCRLLTCVASIGRSLGELTLLKELDLKLQYTAITSTAELREGLVKLRALQRLSLNLSNCRGLPAPVRLRHADVADFTKLCDAQEPATNPLLESGCTVFPL
ncbi:unnamed protein product, partial [Polarella glacialis]